MKKVWGSLNSVLLLNLKVICLSSLIIIKVREHLVLGKNKILQKNWNCRMSLVELYFQNRLNDNAIL